MGKKMITVTPDLASFATPYSSGDVLGSVNALADAVEAVGGMSNLVSLVVLDKANQKSALDLIFFEKAPANSIGADNAAYALNDADLDKVIGRISVAQADYVSSSTNNAEATYKNIQMLLKAARGTRSIAMAIVSRGTPTYGAASDLIIKLGIDQKD